MPTCEYNAIDIGLYLCKKMSADEEMKFHKHLQQCSICRERLKKIKHISQKLLKKDNGKPSLPNTR